MNLIRGEFVSEVTIKEYPMYDEYTTEGQVINHKSGDVIDIELYWDEQS